MWMIRGSLRTLDRPPKLSGSHVQQSEVFRTMTYKGGPYDLNGSAIASIRAHTWICHNIIFKNFKRILQIKSFIKSNKLRNALQSSLFLL